MDENKNIAILLKDIELYSFKQDIIFENELVGVKPKHIRYLPKGTILHLKNIFYNKKINTFEIHTKIKEDTYYTYCFHIGKVVYDQYIDDSQTVKVLYGRE